MVDRHTAQIRRPSDPQTAQVDIFNRAKDIPVNGPGQRIAWMVPAITDSINDVSATVRAIGPCTL